MYKGEIMRFLIVKKNHIYILAAIICILIIGGIIL